MLVWLANVCFYGGIFIYALQKTVFKISLVLGFILLAFFLGNSSVQKTQTAHNQEYTIQVASSNSTKISHRKRIAKICSRKEAETYARKRWRYTKFSFIGMCTKNAKETLYALDSFENRFPGVIDRGLGYVGTMRNSAAVKYNKTKDPFPKGALAYYSPRRHHIALDPKDFNSYNNLVARRKRTISSGLNPKSTSKPRAIVMHELGHFLDYWSRAELGKTQAKKSTIQKWKKKAWAEPYSRKRAVSKYATLNSVELWAETFVQVIYAPETTVLSRRLNKQMLTIRKEIKALVKKVGPPKKRSTFS